MASVTDESFILSVFRPSKNPTPSGIRHTIVKLMKGRTRARVNAWNKMTPAKQEVIRRTGNRDKYLSGKTTYAEAKRQLREKAVSDGIIKTRVRTVSTSDQDIAAHIERLANDRPVDYTKAPVNPQTIQYHVMKMKPSQKRTVVSLATYQELRAAMDDDEFFDQDLEVNLLWYK